MQDSLIILECQDIFNYNSLMNELRLILFENHVVTIL